MERMHFLISGFFFSIALCVVAVLFELENDGFSISNVFLGLIAGALIDMNLKIFYRYKLIKGNRYLENKPGFLDDKKNI